MNGNFALHFLQGLGGNLIWVVFSKIKLVIEGQANFQVPRKHSRVHHFINFRPELVDGLLVEFCCVYFFHTKYSLLVYQIGFEKFLVGSDDLVGERPLRVKYFANKFFLTFNSPTVVVEELTCWMNAFLVLLMFCQSGVFLHIDSVGW